MKNSVLLFILIFGGNILFAQGTKFPDGVYMNIEQLRSMSPEFNADFKIYKKHFADILITGGNDYVLLSDSNSYHKKLIRKKIFAYVKSDSVLINCFRLKTQKDYALVLSNGNFLVFNQFAQILGSNRYWYVLSLRTGNLKPLTQEYLSERLKVYENLLEKYNKEKEKENGAVLLKYIQMLNEVTPIIIPSESK